MVHLKKDFCISFNTNYIMNNTIIDDIEMKLMNISNQKYFIP